MALLITQKAFARTGAGTIAAITVAAAVTVAVAIHTARAHGHRTLLHRHTRDSERSGDSKARAVGRVIRYLSAVLVGSSIVGCVSCKADFEFVAVEIVPVHGADGLIGVGQRLETNETEHVLQNDIANRTKVAERVLQISLANATESQRTIPRHSRQTGSVVGVCTQGRGRRARSERVCCCECACGDVYRASKLPT
jgi:hypothetical protein